MTALSNSQKTSRGVSLYSRFVNRPGGRVLAAAASLTPLTPNHVSLISGVVTAAGVLMVATIQPSAALGVLVWLTLVFGFMLDSADGQLARLMGRGSPAGEWLDHTLDAAKMVALHAAVLVSWYRFYDLPDSRILTVPLLFQAVAVVMFVGGTLAAMALRGRPSSGTAVSTARSSVLLAADYGVFCLVFLLLGWPSTFVLGYCLLAAANLLLLLVLLVKWFGELSALSKPLLRQDRL